MQFSRNQFNSVHFNLSRSILLHFISSWFASFEYSFVKAVYPSLLWPTCFHLFLLVQKFVLRFEILKNATNIAKVRNWTFFSHFSFHRRLFLTGFCTVLTFGRVFIVSWQFTSLLSCCGFQIIFANYFEKTTNYCINKGIFAKVE